MHKICLYAVGVLVISVGIFACSQEQDSKVKGAVEEVVTKDLKAYEGAKRAIGDIEKKAQERMAEEKELLN
jgi:hypothetical protein